MELGRVLAKQDPASMNFIRQLLSPLLFAENESVHQLIVPFLSGEKAAGRGQGQWWRERCAEYLQEHLQQRLAKFGLLLHAVPSLDGDEVTYKGELHGNLGTPTRRVLCHASISLDR
jgi:hypothetical protein